MIQEGDEDQQNDYDEHYDQDGNHRQNPDIFKTDPDPSLPIYR